MAEGSRCIRQTWGGESPRATALHKLRFLPSSRLQAFSIELQHLLRWQFNIDNAGGILRASDQCTYNSAPFWQWNLYWQALGKLANQHLWVAYTWVASKAGQAYCQVSQHRFSFG